MASKNDIYVSVDLKTYKRNKANVLMSQADMLNSMKHIQNIAKLSHQKKLMKVHLYELFESLKHSLVNLEELMPDAHLPSNLKTASISNASLAMPKMKIIENQKKAEHDAKSTLIDAELQEIHDKLALINS
jgi:hypothetical protein